MLTKAEVQRLRSLREKKHREALGLFVVEGEKVVAELLTADFPLHEIYATDQWPGLVAFGTRDQPPKFTVITPSELERISHFPTPSTVFAVGKLVRDPLPPKALDRGLTLALDGVQDAGNVGTLLRIADWFAFDRVILSPDSADVFHQKVINASMGSFARVKTYRVELAATLGEVDRTVPIFGCDLDGASVYELTPQSHAVVVIGSEGRGITPAVAGRLTGRVSIPRFGHAESLNAAVAAGIVCAHLRRASPRPTAQAR